MNKEGLISLIVLLLSGVGLVVWFFWIYNYMKVHRCDNPYKQVCVKSHTETRVVPVFVTINGRTQTQMRPAIIRVCDEYETVLKEGCNAGKDKGEIM